MMQTNRNLHTHQETFPWKHIIGFVLSLALTGGALWFVLSAHFPSVVIVVSILVLAIFQVLVQLLLFMHLNESVGPAYQIIAIIFGFFTAFAVIGGSIWVMAFSSTTS